MTVTVRAPAKINLDLRVLGTRSDGYHEVRTLLQSIELHDTLTIRRRVGPMTVRSRDVAVPPDRQNLVWEAACQLWSAIGGPGDPRDVSISIHKTIPMAAGLGGGSSDAASALKGLSRVWRVRPSRACLQRVASRLGSDVPFFLDGGLAMASGRGERIRRVDGLRSRWVVLVLPLFGVATADAYRWVDVAGPRRHRRLPAGWRRRLGSLSNDLAGPVTQRHPKISEATAGLAAAGAELAAMTGSGSAVFGLFPHRRAAVAARRTLAGRGWRTLLSRTVDRPAFARLTAVTGGTRT